MPQQLEYQAAVPVRRPLVWFHHIVSLLLVGSCWMIVSISAIFVIPRFEMIFKDFKASLPGSTVLLLRFSRWYSNDLGWTWMFLLLGGAVGLGFLIDSTSPQPGRPRRYCYLLWVIVALLTSAYVIAAFIALLSPMFMLMETVSGSKR